MKRNKITRVCSLAMVILMLALTACSENSSQTNNETTASETTSSVQSDVQSGEETEITRANYPDSLPSGLDFGGADYRILTQQVTEIKTISQANEMYVEELNGEVINDAVYNRAAKVMDRLNVNISANLVDDVVGTLRSSIAAGDDICDVAAAYAYYVTPLALEGSFINWLDIPHIDLEKPWWPSSLSEDLIINNRLYFISGDISLKLLQYTYCIFFNKDIANDWNVPDLYSLVLDGKWTLDKYLEIASSVSSDLNGDGELDENDLFGTLNSAYTDTRFAAYDMPISKKNTDGSLELCVMNEKFVDVYTKLYEFYNNSESVIRHKDNLTSIKWFEENHMLFFPHLIVGSEDLRDMQSDYGIVPYPKYDENQESYATIAHDNYSLMCVPAYIDESRFEMIGAVTEAMAAESYRTVTPAYLEVALKDKFLRDEHSAAMLDIIMSGMKFDPAGVYSNSLGDVLHIIRGIYDKQENIVSFYEKREKVYTKAFEKFNEKYLALE